MGQGHNPASVTFTPRATPDSVVFTERSTAATSYTERSTSATKSLEPLRARKRSDGFWLFLSGLANGTMFTRTSAGWQLLAGLAAFGAGQRMGQEESGDFVLVIEDNS